MQNIEHNGLSLKLYPLHGEVVKIDQTTTTSFSSHGGGSHTDLEGKFTIRPISITSQTRYEREVWIKDMKGKEHTIMLNDATIKLREGNLVTVGLVENGNTQSLISLKNHATEDQYSLSSSDALVNSYNFSKINHTTGPLTWLCLAGIAGVGMLYIMRYLFRVTGLEVYLVSSPGLLQKVSVLTALGPVVLVPLIIIIYGFRRGHRAVRDHQIAVEKVKTARKMIMAEPHPAIGT